MNGPLAILDYLCQYQTQMGFSLIDQFDQLNVKWQCIDCWHHLVKCNMRALAISMRHIELLSAVFFSSLKCCYSYRLMITITRAVFVYVTSAILADSLSIYCEHVMSPFYIQLEKWFPYDASMLNVNWYVYFRLCSDYRLVATFFAVQFFP